MLRITTSIRRMRISSHYFAALSSGENNIIRGHLGRSQHQIELRAFSASASSGDAKIKSHNIDNSAVKGDAQSGNSSSTSTAHVATAATTAVAEPAKPNMLVGMAQNTWWAVTHPKESWVIVKEGALHYWLGTKLLWREIKLATDIVGRVLTGHGMTRRERQQLVRTTGDIFRMFPLAVFIIVPFMELLLPFCLKLFPNMLPSTFQEKYKVEENMKKEIEMRLQVTGFFTETLQSMAKKKSTDPEKPGGKDISDFIEKARLGQPLPNETVIRIAAHFKDELTLANVQRPQLVVLCQYMGLAPFGADAFLRFQLRTKLRALKEDDRRILWEGLDSLTLDELRSACQERGMRSVDLNEYAYKLQLKEWLDLSIQKNIPISLLIMSRALLLRSSKDRFAPRKAEDVMKDAMSSLDSETINEIVLAATTSKEEQQDSIAVTQRKLESLEFQKVMIAEEREESADAKESLKSKDKAGAEVAAAVPTPGSAVNKTETMPDSVHKAATAAALATAGTIPPPAKELDRLDAGSPYAAAATHSATEVASQAVPISVPLVEPTAKTVSDTTAPAPTSTPAVPPPAESVVSRITHSVASLMGSTPTSTGPVEHREKELNLHEMQALSDLARGSSVEREKSELAKLEARLESMEVAKPKPKAAATETVETDVSAKSKAQTTETSPETASVVQQAVSAVQKAVEVLTAQTPAVAPSSPVKTASASTDEFAKVDAGSPFAQQPNPPESQGMAKPVAPKSVPEAPPKVEEISQEDKSILAMQDALKGMVSNLKLKIEDVEGKLSDKLPQLDLDKDGYVTRDEMSTVLTQILKAAPTQAEAAAMITEMDVDGDGKISVAELLKFVQTRKEKKDVEVLEGVVNASKATKHADIQANMKAQDVKMQASDPNVPKTQ